MTESLSIMDASGFALAYVYCVDDPQRASVMDRMLRKEARWIAVNMTLLPDLLTCSRHEEARRAMTAAGLGSRASKSGLSRNEVG